MYCINCGHKITQHSIYCPSCGVKLGEVKDSVSDGMQSFSVSSRDSVTHDNSTDWGEIAGLIFVIIGVVLLNLVFGVITFFTTSYLIDLVVAMDSDTASFSENWWVIFYVIPVILWQYLNDKIFDWYDELDSDAVNKNYFLPWTAILIPIVPTLISFYVTIQNEYLPITMKNWLIYILSITTCLIYYWIKKSEKDDIL